MSGNLQIEPIHDQSGFQSLLTEQTVSRRKNIDDASLSQILKSKRAPSKLFLQKEAMKQYQAPKSTWILDSG